MDKSISLKIIDDTKVLVYDNYRLVFPGTDLQSQAVQWYHHYLQHPGHSRLEETLSAVMWWQHAGPHESAHKKMQKMPARQEMHKEVWTSSSLDSRNHPLAMCLL